MGFNGVLVFSLTGTERVEFVFPSHQSTSHRSTSHRSTSHQSTSHQSTSHQSTSHQPTSHQSTSHQSTSHQSTVYREPRRGVLCLCCIVLARTYIPSICTYSLIIRYNLSNQFSFFASFPLRSISCLQQSWKGFLFQFRKLPSSNSCSVRTTVQTYYEVDR